MKQAIRFGATAIACMVLYSCQVDDFDPNCMDKTIALGGDSLVIPLGNTSKLMLGDFTSKVGDYLVKSEDGSYYFEFKQSFESKGDFPEFTAEQRELGAMEQFIPISLSLPNPGIPAGIPAQTIPSLSFPVSRNTVLKIEMDDEVTKYLGSLDSLIFEGCAQLACTVNMSQLPNVGTNPCLDLKIKFPSRYIFEDSRIVNNELVLTNEQIRQGDPFILEPLKLRGIAFDGEPIAEHFVMQDNIDIDINISYTNAIVSYEVANNLSINGAITVNVSNTVLKEIYGVLKYSSDTPQTSEIEIEDLPNEIRNQMNVLDACPVMDLLFTSNISIPIRTNMNITPYCNAEAMTDRVIDFSMDLPAADRKAESTTSHIHIGPTPVQEAHVNVNKDLSPLLKSIPDKIRLEYTMGTIQNVQHYLDLSKSIIASIDCNVRVPLSFGPDFYFNYTDTMDIEDMDSKIMELLQDNRLHLIMDFNSTLPFDIKLDLKFLDQDGRPANKIEIPEQTINAGTRNQERKTHLDIVVSDSKKSVKNLSGLIYSLTVTAPEGNACIYSDTYLQAKMSFMAQGGIIINLDNNEN